MQNFIDWICTMPMLYSGGNKFVIFCFALLLPQILDNFQNRGQFWNLLVLTISKHPLHMQFDEILAEIFEVKDTRYHSFLFLKFFFWNLIDMKITQIWTIWSKNCPVHHKRHQFQQELFLEMEGLGCFIYCFSHKMFRSQ